MVQKSKIDLRKVRTVRVWRDDLKRTISHNFRIVSHANKFKKSLRNKGSDYDRSFKFWYFKETVVKEEKKEEEISQSVLDDVKKEMLYNWGGWAWTHLKGYRKSNMSIMSTLNSANISVESDGTFQLNAEDTDLNPKSGKKALHVKLRLDKTQSDLSIYLRDWSTDVIMSHSKNKGGE